MVAGRDMPPHDQVFVYRGWYRWSVVVGPFIAISPPFWPYIFSALRDYPEFWNHVFKGPIWAYLVLAGLSALFLWAYCDMQFWRRDIRVTSDDVTSLLFGRRIRNFRWADITSIAIIEDYNQDRMKREVRCKLQAGSGAIGFKDYIQGYDELQSIVEERAREFRIPVRREDHSGRFKRIVSKS